MTPHPRSCLLVLGVTIACVALATAQAPATITLDRGIHLFQTDGADVLVSPGTYSVEAAGADALRLVSAESHRDILLRAVPTGHDERVAEPRALSIPDEQEPDLIHLVLLLPDGKALDAVGSYSGIRTRAGALAVSRARITAVVQTPATGPPAPPPSPAPPSQAAAAPSTPAAQSQETRGKVVLLPDSGPSGTVVQVSACGLQAPPGTPVRVKVSGLGAPDQELIPAPCAKGGYGFGPGTALPPVPMKVQAILGGNSVAVDLFGPNSTAPIERSVGFYGVRPSVAVGKIATLNVRTELLAKFDQCVVNYTVIVTLDSLPEIRFGIMAKSDMADAMIQALQEAWGRDRPVRITYDRHDFLSCHPPNPIMGVEALR